MVAFMKEFDANKHRIGWMEGYSAERAMREAKVAKQNERSEKKGRTE
jgi:hypothetical protein